MFLKLFIIIIIFNCKKNITSFPAFEKEGERRRFVSFKKEKKKSQEQGGKKKLKGKKISYDNPTYIF